MPVTPGFAGQSITPAAIEKIRACRLKLNAMGYDHVPLQVDGNVSFEWIPDMVATGARRLVVGTSSLFHTSQHWQANRRRIDAAVAQGLAQHATESVAVSI